jgi:hypothetical protein
MRLFSRLWWKNVRSDRRLKWSSASEDLQQPQPPWRDSAAGSAIGWRVGSAEGSEHQAEEANANLGVPRTARRADRDLPARLVRLPRHDWELGLRHWREEAVPRDLPAVNPRTRAGLPGQWSLTAKILPNRRRLRPPAGNGHTAVARLRRQPITLRWSQLRVPHRAPAPAARQKHRRH